MLSRKVWSCYSYFNAKIQHDHGQYVYKTLDSTIRRHKDRDEVRTIESDVDIFSGLVVLLDIFVEVVICVVFVAWDIIAVVFDWISIVDVVVFIESSSWDSDALTDAFPGAGTVELPVELFPTAVPKRMQTNTK